MVHVRRKEAEAISARRFGLIHRKVRQTQQFIGGGTIFGNKRDTNAGTDELLDPANHIGITDCCEQVGAHGCGFIIVLEILKNNGEFIPADARGKAVDVQGGRKTLGDLAQQNIACLVSARVVNDFKSVEVEQQQRRNLAACLALIDSRAHPLCKQRAIGKAREHIMQGKMCSVFFGKFARRDVKAGSQDAYDLVIFVPQR